MVFVDALATVAVRRKRVSAVMVRMM